MSYAVNIDVFPLWSLLPLTLFLVLVSLEVGHRFGEWRHRQPTKEKEEPVGSMVNAMVGLLAFILAFTFGMASSRYETRRSTFLEEVNSIGTVYLRTNFLDEPQRSKVRKLLREYVDDRVNLAKENNLEEVIRRSETLHNELWAETSVAAEKNSNSIMLGLFVNALNQMIDLHTSRVNVGLRARIPDIIWLVLYSITVASMLAMGYHSGLSNSRRSIAALGMAFCFSAILYLIADLERPLEGSLRVNQQAMIDLQQSMKEPTAGSR